MGLGGLLLFTFIATVGSWRTADRAREAATEAGNASILVQDLARQMAAREAASGASADLAYETGKLSELREQAQTIVDQQGRLHDAVRNLVEAGVLKTD